MKKFTKKFIVMLVAFSMLMAGAFASGGSEVQAAVTAPAKVTVKSARADSSHKKVIVSWKGVKYATGYQISYRKTNSSVCKTIAVRGTTTKTFAVDTNQAGCRLKVRAFRQIKVKGKVRTYYGKWSDVKTVNKKYIPPRTNTNSGGKTNSSSGGNSQSSGGTAAGSQVWIPKSRKKYHSTPSCSGMKNPTKVSKSYAVSVGYTPCKKCY